MTDVRRPSAPDPSTKEPAAADSVELAERASRWKSAYVHIPFCDAVCPYCDFAVVAGRDDLADRYLAALEHEIETEAPWNELDSVFVGGGTPSRVGARSIGRLLEALARRFGIRPGSEVTLEANPEDIDPELADGLVAAGVTRLSLGAQSLDPDVLRELGRRHNPDGVASAVAAARRAGMASVSLDLIYGTPGESLDSWHRTLTESVDLEPDHISTYALTVEAPTALGRAVREGAPGPDPDDQADKWEMATEVLAEAGLTRYEVSNHARAGHACAYNLSVWGMGEYLAFGLGAHGYRDGIRTRRVRRIDTYVRRIESGVGAVQASEPIEGRVREQERLMVGLRRAAGVEAGELGADLIESAAGRRLIAAGVLAIEGSRLKVARPLLTDDVVRVVLDL